jgi:hypothetical protein
MALLQIPLNFKFKPLFHVSSSLEDEGSPSFAQPITVSSTNISPNQITFNSSCENLSNQIPPKKWKLYESSKKFQDAWTTHFPCVESSLMKKGWCSKSNAKFAHLLEGRKNC